MEELLERMLAVDQQGEALVKSAEEQAVRIREESSRELAAKSAEASRLLSEECRRLEEEAVSGAECQKAEALKASASRLSPRAESFSKELESYRYKLLKELLAV